MEVALPYYFDSSTVVKLIVRGVLLLLLAVIVPGILYSLFVTHSGAAALSLLISAALLAYFGRIFHQNLEGSCGVITANAVEVEPVFVYGIKLNGPTGRFSLQQFKAVRVERAPAPTDVEGSRHERVSLVGKNGTRDLLIARTERDAGISLAQGLAAAVGLPYEEVRVPY